MGDGSESLQRRTEIDYKEQAYKLELRFKYDRMGLLQLASDLCKDCSDAGKSIIELLARAEAEEERCKELEDRCKRLNEARERANEAAAKWESMYRVALERAERAEETASDLCDDFTDFVTGGVHNAAPYCANHRPECVNAYGWCDGDNRVCRGFMPKAAGREEE